MVKSGDADGMLTGYSRSYPSVVKPIIDIIGKAKGVSRIAASNIMLTERGPIFLSDTSLNIDPGSKELAIIAKMTSDLVEMFGLKPIIALLSFSNFGSSRFSQADKVSKAVKYLHKVLPNLIVAALSPELIPLPAASTAIIFTFSLFK